MSLDTQIFHEFDEKLASARQTFQNNIQKYVSDMNNSRNEYDSQIEELSKRQIEMKNKIKEIEKNEAKLQNLLTSELEEYNEASKKIEELQKNEANLKNKRNELNDKIETLNLQIDKKKQSLESSKKDLTKNLHKDLEFCKLYERFLGLKIDSASDDLIKFIFTNLSQSDSDLTFEVVLDLSDVHGLYKVASMSYQLPKDTVEQITNELNETRSLVQFLKSLRNCFIENY